MSACDDLLHPHPHVALLPSAGMGHLTPFLRLATQLVHHHCNVTLITTHPIVSLSESKLITHFLTAFPQVNQVKFNLLPLDHTTANSTDPFFLHFETIRRSAHLLFPLLASLSPPLHALVCDVTLISSVIPITESLHLPNYMLFTSSAKMLSFFSYFHIYASKAGDDDPAMLGDVEIPGLPSIPRSSIPPLLLIPDNIFANIFKVDSPKVTKSNGFLINTFEGLEALSLELLNGGKVVEGMPPVFAVGPLVPCDFEKGELGNNQLAATTIVMMMDGVYVKSNCGFVYMKTLIKSEKMSIIIVIVIYHHHYHFSIFIVAPPPLSPCVTTATTSTCYDHLYHRALQPLPPFYDL